MDVAESALEALRLEMRAEMDTRMTPLERDNKALATEVQHLRSELHTQGTELQHARKALGAAERAADVQAHELAARRQAIAELQASARDDEMWRRHVR